MPSIGYNLISTGRLADNGIESHFRRKDLVLKFESNGQILGSSSRHSLNKMYTMPNPISQNDKALSISSESQATTALWHRRLAHVNVKDLSALHKHADGVPELPTMMDVCRSCRLGKAHKLPFHGHFQKTSRIGEVIHSDIVGKLDLSYPSRYRYVCTFLDDFSRYTFIAFLRSRDEVKDAFQQVIPLIRTENSDTLHFSQSSNLMKLHSDGAEEYKAILNDFGGVVFEKSFSPPYTPELNGIAERVNRTMIEASRSLLIQAKLPKCLWPYALKHVIHALHDWENSFLNIKK